MKIAIATFAGIILHVHAFLQCDSLYFVELGFEPSQCRTEGYQCGNGVVYAAAESANGPCEYTWKNLLTGATNHNTTWGGLNPGEYKITVVDSIGCSISEIVKLDSVIPQANFILTSTTINSSDSGYVEAELVFTNNSIHFGDNVIEPWPEEFYAWNHDNSTWISATLQDDFTVIVNTPGYHEICLAGMNNHGCVDTLCQSFLISENLDSTVDISVNYSSYTGEISVELLTEVPAQISFYSLDGVLLQQSLLTVGSNTFFLTSGTYVYEVVNTLSGIQLLSGILTIL